MQEKQDRELMSKKMKKAEEENDVLGQRIWKFMVDIDYILCWFNKNVKVSEMDKKKSKSERKDKEKDEDKENKQDEGNKENEGFEIKKRKWSFQGLREKIGERFSDKYQIRDQDLDFDKDGRQDNEVSISYLKMP